MLGRSNNMGGTLLVLKPVSVNKEKEAVKPYFEISRKVGNEWEVDQSQDVSSVSGELVKIEAVEDEYKGDKYFRIKIYIKDGEELYLIPTRLNIAARGLLNSIFSLENYKDVSISFYRTKAGYETFFLSQNDERVSWKYAITDLPKADEVTFKGKTIRDYSKVDAFYVEQVQELSAKLGKVNNAVNKKEVEETQEEESVEF